ncbi:MAG: alpha/beta hydrolase family protein [Minicystis sp.]
MLRDVLNRAASHVDTALGAAIFHRSAASRARSRSESLGHAERMAALDEIIALYDREEHYPPGAPFFAAPGPITPRATSVRALRGGEVSDWTWPSTFALHCEAVAERYLGPEANQRAAARVYLHADWPRPAVILLHGYRAGQFAVEERVWPVGWLFEKGLDVAILVLPFHGVRAHRRGAPLFPGSDPRITNEGFRQAVLDVRALLHHLLGRGAPAVGVMGMSLGGYTASLVATVEDRVSFAVPIIPLASLADVADKLGRLVGTAEEQRLQREALDRAHRAVSPLSRAPRLARDRVLVAAAEGDRITPLAHAERLAAHFGAPLTTFPGGHLLQLGRGQAFREVGRMLGRLGLLEGRA